MKPQFCWQNKKKKRRNIYVSFQIGYTNRMNIYHLKHLEFSTYAFSIDQKKKKLSHNKIMHIK